MPVGEFHRPTELAHFRKIRERLVGPSVEIWVLILGDWVKLYKIKPPQHISPFGLTVEACLKPENELEFDIIHIRRESPCRYKGTALDKGTKVHHVTAISARPKGGGSIKPVPPVIDLVPNAPPLASDNDNTPTAHSSASPRSIMVGSKLMYISTLIVILGFSMKIIQPFQDFDIGKVLGGHLETGITKILDCTLWFVIRFESALTKSIANILWQEHSKWVWAPDCPILPWIIRFCALVIFFFCKQVSLLAYCPYWVKNPFNVLAATPASTPLEATSSKPAPLGLEINSKPSRSPSEIDFDSPIMRCQADKVNFRRDNKIRKLDKDTCLESASVGDFSY